MSVDASEVQSLQATLGTLQLQNAALRQLVVIHDRLGALVLQGADVSAVTRMLADLVGRRVLLLDALLQVVTMAVPSHNERPRQVASSHRERPGQGMLSSPDERPGKGVLSSSDERLGQGAVSSRDSRPGQVAEGTFTWAPGQEYVRAVLATLARERRPLRVPPMAALGVDASCVLAPVAVGDAMLGYLAILAEGEDAAGEDLDLQIVQHAATVYALSMMRERVAAEVARQLKDDLFEGLLLGRTQDEQIAQERAMRLGYNPAVAYRVLVVVAESGADEATPETVAQRRRLLEGLAEVCGRRSADVFAGVREDELVVLAPEQVAAQELGRGAVQQASALLPTWRVTAGIGGVCSSASGIARSYAQACRALETARRFGHQGDVVAFEDLGVYRLLFHVTDPAELRDYVDQVLGPLIDYDARHNADLVRTLGTFLAFNGNLQATARELSLHVNSVAYRIQRIQSIAKLDLEQAEDRLLAQVALKIVRGV